MTTAKKCMCSCHKRGIRCNSCFFYATCEPNGDFPLVDASPTTGAADPDGGSHHSTGSDKA